MPNTQQVGWWSRMTSSVNSAVTAEQTVGVVPPLKKGGEGGFKDSYQDIGHCKDLVDCLAQGLGSSLWAPLAAAFGGLKILGARDRKLTWEGAAQQLEQGEALIKDGNRIDAARLLGAAAISFGELDEGVAEAWVEERIGDALRFEGWGGFVISAEKAFERSAAIFGRLIDGVAGGKTYEILTERLNRAQAALFEKAGSFDEAAGIYKRLEEPYEQGKALILGGRYKDAVSVLERGREYIGVQNREFSLLLDGTKRMAAADKVAQKAKDSEVRSETAPKAFRDWAKARGLFYGAALGYRSGGFFLLEAVALEKALEAIRWEAATYNGPFDNRPLQRRYLREMAIARGKAGYYREAAVALGEETALREEIKAGQTLYRLKKSMLKRAERALGKGELKIEDIQSDSTRRTLAIRNLVSSVRPEMFSDAPAVNGVMRLLAELISPDRDAETVLEAVRAGDGDVFRALSKDIFISRADWDSLVRIAGMIDNARINAMVGMFVRLHKIGKIHTFAEYSLPEMRRVAEAIYGEYAKLSPSRRAEYGIPEDGEYLPGEFVDEKVTEFNRINSAGGTKASILESFEGGGSRGDTAPSFGRPAVDMSAAGTGVGRGKGGISEAAARDAEEVGRKVKEAGRIGREAGRAARKR